jgi:hypothetical protein
VRQLVYAACFFEVGLLLVALPWTQFWDRNYLFDALPVLGSLTHSPYLRGAVSGLGVLNVGLGIAEVTSFVGTRLDQRSREPELAPPSELR